MKKLIFLISLFVIIFNNIQAQDILGDWHGLREYPNRPLRMVLHIEKDGDSYKANYDSPENDLYGIELDSFNYQIDTLSKPASDRRTVRTRFESSQSSCCCQKRLWTWGFVWSIKTQLDLQAVFLISGNSRGSKAKAVGNKHISLTRLGIAIGNT